MRVLEFLRSMLPMFKRSEVIDLLRHLKDDLVNQTLSVFITAQEDRLGSESPKSKALKLYVDQQATAVHSRGRNWLEVQIELLRKLQTNLDVVEGLIESQIGQDVIVAGLTYRKAQFLQFAAIAQFTVDYARQNLLYLLACEANVKARTLEDGKERPVPEIRWLLDNRDTYFKALTLLAVEGDVLQRVLSEVPDITITELSAQTAPEVFGAAKLDPLRMGIIPIGMNPFHFIGVRWANRQVAKYQRAKEECRSLEFRLEQLRNQRVGTEDPKLEKTIAYYEGEVDKLAAQIAKFEV